jgi:hypothetical protein
VSQLPVCSPAGEHSPNGTTAAAEPAGPRKKSVLWADQQHESFSVEAPVSEAAVMRRVDWHLLPFFFSLALLCTIDRGALF